MIHSHVCFQLGSSLLCFSTQRWGGLLEGRMVSSLIAIQRGCTSTAAGGIELRLCFAIYDHRLSMLMLLFFMTEDQADASVSTFFCYILHVFFGVYFMFFSPAVCCKLFWECAFHVVC
jgi:hypothetical protein